VRLLCYQEKGSRKDAMELLFDIWKTKKSNGNPKYNDKNLKDTLIGLLLAVSDF